MANLVQRLFMSLLPLVLFAADLDAVLADDKPAPSSSATAAPALVGGIRVLPDKVADCSSLKAIVESVTRGCKTNDEKAIAIYNFMRLTHYHREYPSEPGGISVLKEINCYGWSLCGGLHAEQSALWREMGWNWRFVGWPGHTTVEAFYDGRWHYLDVFLKFYAWMPDSTQPGGRTIAGEDDLAAHPQELVTNAFTFDKSRGVVYAKGNQFELIGNQANWQAPAFLVCGDELAGVVDGVTHKNRVGPEPGWAGMNHATGDYSADVNLAPGFTLTNTWDKADGAWYWAGSKTAPCHTCGDKEIRNSPEKGPVVEPYLGANWRCESYANGQLVFSPQLSDSDCLQSFSETRNVKATSDGLSAAEAGKPASVTVLLQTPYIFTQASGSAEGAEKFEVSLDNGSAWKTADLKDFGAMVGGQVKVLARITFKDRLKNLRLQATVQNNPFALPYLSPGKNTVSVGVADSASLGKNKLVVTYAYRTGSRGKTYEQLCLEGKELGRAHDASWETSPTVVQKTFSAGDLPASFDIDVPTPRGRYPVYPRMLFVRREVLAPDQAPLPLPADALSSTVKADDVLASLPNPLLVGTGPAPVRVARDVTTTTVALEPGGFVTKSGQAPQGDTLRWPKNNQEKVEQLAYLIGGKLPELPAAENFAAARLVFSLTGSHDKAPTKVGLVELKAPGATQERFDVSQLGDMIGDVIVPSQAADTAAWNPPKEFKIDVTSYLRSLAMNKQPFRGFALRVVPDRGVDDGWTVRVELPKAPRIALEIDTYTSEPQASTKTK